MFLSESILSHLIHKLLLLIICLFMHFLMKSFGSTEELPKTTFFDFGILYCLFLSPNSQSQNYGKEDH